MLKKSISFILMMFLLSGCNNPFKSDDSSTAQTTPVSGKAIDGYIKEATVLIKNKSTDETITTITTDGNGSFSFDKPSGVDIIVEISDGIDTSTGEAFSGVMKNIISKDTTDTKLNVTPLTSLIAELVISGEQTDISTARDTIATSMDIDLDTLDSDPIEVLKSGTDEQKLKAANMMKSILTIQKFAEVVSSVSDDTSTAHQNIFKIIAKKLNNSSNLKLNSVLDANNTDELIDDIRNESGSSLEKDKFDAIKELTKNTVSILNDLNITELKEASDIDAKIASNAQAIEVLVIPLKEKLKDIRQATNTTEIATKKEKALNIVKATISLGGIKGISTTLANKTEDTTISDFANSFLSDTVVEEKANNYNNAINSGKSIEDVINDNKNNTAQTVVVQSFGKLSGVLYKDLNSNTSKDTAEVGIKNITVTIKDKLTTKSVVTDENGYFLVSNLTVGDVNITIDLADTDMPEGVNGTNSFTKTIVKDTTTDMGNIAFTFGDANSIDPSTIATCQNPISFTWDGSTVDGSSKTIWEDIKNNNNKEIVIGGYTVTLTYSDINGQFNNIDSGTINEDNTTTATDGNITHGFFGSPYLTLYMGDDNDKNTTSGSLEKGDMVTFRVDFNDSVVLDNWLFRDIDSGNIRDSSSGWDWQDSVKIKGYDAQHNPVQMSINLSQTTNLQIVNGVVRTEDNITTGPGTDTTDPKGHARWSSNGHAIKYMIVEFSSGSAINHPTRSAIAASGFSFCPVSANTAPTLTVIPTSTTENNISVEVNGIVGATIFINGLTTNLTIDNTGSQTITLNTLGGAGVKTFKIELEKDGVRSDVLTISIQKTVQSATPTRAEAIKFLRQAAFRMTEDEISYVIENGYEAWIDNQFSMVGDTDNNTDTKYGYVESMFRVLNKIDSTTYPEAIFSNPTSLDESDIDKARISVFRGSVFWDKALNDENQLRQRIAYALSQIIVTSDVSPAGQATKFRGETTANYFDILYKHSFGNYRELLTDVTHSSAMGYFMTYVGGKKEAPDENYARELTQLFTVGLYELNDDGTLQGGGSPIPSFDQQHVTDLAKVFTGWDLDDKQTNSKGVNARYGSTAKTDNSWISPLQFTVDHHDSNSTLDLIGSATMNTTADGSVDIKNALDILFANHNVAPFISRHLIMRLVTSNPTPEYVGRVSTVFNDNGSGVKGDLKAVVKTILLDNEARGVTQPTNFGKVDELLVAFPHFLSVFNARPIPKMRFSNGSIVEDIFWLDPSISFEQGLLSSDTVFNFYSNEFVPSDPYFADNNLVSPELQIQNTPNLIGYSNLIKKLFKDKEKYSQVDIGSYDSMNAWATARNFGQYTLEDGLYYVDLTDEYEVFEKSLDNEAVANGDFANMGDIDENIEDRVRATKALLEHLDNKLLGGDMPEAYKTEILEHVAGFTHPKTDTGRKDRAKAIITITIQAIVTSPLFMVLK